MSHIRINLCVFAACLATLSACGGGSSNPPAQYPVDTAFSAYYQAHHHYHLTATSGNDVYQLDLDLTPEGQASFNGIQAMTAKLSVEEAKDGSPVGAGTETLYFLTGPYVEIGSQLSTGVAVVDSGQKDLPELTATGSGGTLDSQKYYSSINLNSQIASGTRTWSLDALTADTAQFCIHDDDDLGGSAESEDDCYTMDIKGNITALELTQTSGGLTLMFK